LGSSWAARGPAAGRTCGPRPVAGCACPGGMASSGGTGAATVALDLAAGSVGGMAGVLCGHPLDVVKTRMQASSSSLRSLNMYDCLAATCRHEGWLALWRGVGPPLFGVALYQATVFASYEWSFKQATRMGVPEPSALAAAGLLSGAASCLVTVPTDAVKIQLQLEHGSSEGAVKDSLRCGRRMVAERGVGSLFRGMAACLWRDVPATVAYFATYTRAKRACLWCFGDSEAAWSNTAAELMAGGLAGTVSWGMAIPTDVLKTVVQESAATGRPLGLAAAVREIHQRDGMRGFTRGAGPIVARAFPVNAITFMVYERAKTLLGVPSSL